MDISYKSNIVVICREIDKSTGKVALHQVSRSIDYDLLERLDIKTRANTGLRYFAVPQVRWDSPWQKDYIQILERPKVTPRDLELIGGIVEL